MEWGGGKNGLLLAVRDGCLVDACGDYGRRFGERGGGWIHVDALEQWLRQCRVLESEAPDVGRARKLLGALERRAQGRGVRRGGVGDGESDEEQEEEGRYDCGLAGCSKAFAHSHVGMEGVGLPGAFGAAGQGEEGAVA